jgi:signal peptidase II
MQRRSVRATVLLVLATVALLATDLGSKAWAESTLSQPRTGAPPPICEGRPQRLPGYRTTGADGQPRIERGLVLLDPVLELSYTENCGAAFGMFDSAPRWVFLLAAIAASIAFFWMFVQGRGGPLFVASVPLIVSGALGNFFDRARLGYVVDFIRFHYDQPFDILGWHFERFEYPTFNVADITIVIGMVLLILDGVRSERKAGAEEGGSDEAEDLATPGRS